MLLPLIESTLLWVSPSVWLTLWISLLGAFILHMRGNKRYQHLPSPGPPLPLIGHLHLLSTSEGRADPVNYLWQLYKKHSKSGLLWTKLFNMNIIHVGDFTTMKYIFSHPDAQERFLPWTHLRQFTIKSLKDFGFGKADMNTAIGTEVQDFVAHLHKSCEEPKNLSVMLNQPILNSMLTIAVGKRFDYEDPKMKRMLVAISKLVQRYYCPTKLSNLAQPLMGKIAPIMEILGRNESITSGWDIMQMTKGEKTDMDFSELQDILQEFLHQVDPSCDSSYKFYGTEGQQQLASTFFDLFAVGAETTCIALSWGILYMLRYPEVQAKVQKELDTVVGQDRMPNMEDKPHLPYTQATLMEVQRYSNTLPSGVAHYTRRDISVNGCTIIPANTIIHANFTEILKGSYWGDGEVFRPERFITASAGLRPEERLVPHATGRRQCPGQLLAQTELFLFFSGLLHAFTLEPEFPAMVPTEDYNLRIAVSPKPFQVKLNSRF